ncbi:hypothetical protein [Streptacidiphilus anmyonensis]|uniref:hypothetical protein n=1 Tax=Streptacidiphilus anmyonensis TaxID=405782 RepID=UPI0013649E24|nr:hypothetical protein [Streptacidiphilus anmyonensis]
MEKNSLPEIGPAVENSVGDAGGAEISFAMWEVFEPTIEESILASGHHIAGI